MIEEVVESIERGWILVKIDEEVAFDDLRKAVQAVWFRFDQDSVREANFIVRADLVSNDARNGNEVPYKVMAPACAVDRNTLYELAGAFGEALAAELGVELIVAVAFADAYTPNPPQNNAPGYIAEDEALSPKGKLRDNPWG
jgi:hypothetical protein